MGAKKKKKNDANYLQSEENDYQRIICSVKLVDMKLLPDLHWVFSNNFLLKDILKGVFQEIGKYPRMKIYKNKYKF